MKTRTPDVEAAKLFEYEELRDFPYLTEEQLLHMKRLEKRQIAWRKRHIHFNNILNMIIMLAYFVGDYAILCLLPEVLPLDLHSIGGALLGALIVGVLHGWVLYCIAYITVHDAATHHVLILPTNRFYRFVNRVIVNLGRITLVDPAHYSRAHWMHHRHFADPEKDGTFLNFIPPERLFGTLLPLQPFLNFTDFFPFIPNHYTRPRLISMAMTLGYMGLYSALMIPEFGLLFTMVSLGVVGAWVATALDRLRESTEHNLMPLDDANGAREFGGGFWGVLLGAGPFCQPFHLSHHLAPQISWYQLWPFHWELKRIMTPEQRRASMVEPVIGYPKLLVRLFLKTREYEKRVQDSPDTVRNTES